MQLHSEMFTPWSPCWSDSRTLFLTYYVVKKSSGITTSWPSFFYCYFVTPISLAFSSNFSVLAQQLWKWHRRMGEFFQASLNFRILWPIGSSDHFYPKRVSPHRSHQSLGQVSLSFLRQSFINRNNEERLHLHGLLNPSGFHFSRLNCFTMLGKMTLDLFFMIKVFEPTYQGPKPVRRHVIQKH